MLLMTGTVIPINSSNSEEVQKLFERYVEIILKHQAYGNLESFPVCEVSYVYDRKGEEQQADMNDKSSYRGGNETHEVVIRFRLPSHHKGFLNLAKAEQKKQDEETARRKREALEAQQAKLRQQLAEIDAQLSS